MRSKKLSRYEGVDHPDISLYLSLPPFDGLGMRKGLLVYDVSVTAIAVLLRRRRTPSARRWTPCGIESQWSLWHNVRLFTDLHDHLLAFSIRRGDGKRIFGLDQENRMSS